MDRVIFCYTAYRIATLFSVSTASAQSEYDLAQIVQKRTLIMKSMLKSYFPLIAIKNGNGLDLTAAAEAALSISDAMTSSLSLFPEGTAKGEAPGSRAKQEVWSFSEEFRSAVEELVKTTDELADVAKSGDVEAFKTQFEAVKQACIGCHEFKPSGGGKYRFPK